MTNEIGELEGKSKENTQNTTQKNKWNLEGEVKWYREKSGSNTQLVTGPKGEEGG